MFERRKRTGTGGRGCFPPSVCSLFFSVQPGVFCILTEKNREQKRERERVREKEREEREREREKESATETCATEVWLPSTPSLI